MVRPKTPRARGRSPSGVKHSAYGGSEADELPQFEISGQPLRIVLVDNALPLHTTPSKNGGPQVTYVPGEIAHFEICGHRYALVSERLVTHQASDVDDRNSLEARNNIHSLLTNRELQIVQLICMGYLTKQVACRLKLSEFTVRSYLKTVYCKLSVRSRGAMVYRYAQAFLHASEYSADQSQRNDHEGPAPRGANRTQSMASST